MKRFFATKVNSVLVFALIGFSILVISMPTLARAQTLTRELQFGMSGSDVSALQAFLALNSSIYPEGMVTGYFGSLTRAAVARFQASNGLPAVGRVGPMTLPVINAQMGGSTTTRVPITAPNIGLSSTSATVNFNTANATRANIYYSLSPIVASESLHDVTVTGASTASVDTNLRGAHSIPISNLSPNTTYYYMVYTTDAAGAVNVTFPATFRTN